eukprot:snap_masked-scaffold_9-processed-gene-11.38-mRNA-1 protein AED:1.00 eAED:1.00 QI:0/-1/0/0/-1/1/1/0/80
MRSRIFSPQLIVAILCSLENDLNSDHTPENFKDDELKLFLAIELIMYLVNHFDKKIFLVKTGKDILLEDRIYFELKDFFE